MSSPLEAALDPSSRAPTSARAGALPPLAAAAATAEPGTPLSEKLKQKKSSKERGNKIAPLVVAPAPAASITQNAAVSSSSGSSSSKPAASPSCAATASPSRPPAVALGAFLVAQPPLPDAALPSKSKSKSKSGASASKYAAGAAPAAESEKGEQRKPSSGGSTAAAAAPSPSHTTIRVRDDVASAPSAATAMITEAELLSEIDRTIDLYPLLEETHLENRMLLEPLLAYFCCCCLSSRSQRSLLRTLHEWLSNFLPLLSLLWLVSMVLSLMFLVDLMPESYLPALVFSGVYPAVRLCFASIPVLRLLLGSFETWFLLIQAGLLVAAFGALAAWDLRFAFVTGCLLPSIVQIILLDANYSSSVAFTSLAMAFGALYMAALALLLGTGQIVRQDIVLDCRWFRVGLTDFCIQRLITLMLFIVKNICMLLSEPQAYLGIYGLVSRKPVQREPAAAAAPTTSAGVADKETAPTTTAAVAPSTATPDNDRPARRDKSSRDKTKDKTQQELRWTKTRRSLV